LPITVTDTIWRGCGVYAILSPFTNIITYLFTYNRLLYATFTKLKNPHAERD